MGLTNPISRSSPQTVWNFSLERRRYLGLGRRISESMATGGLSEVSIRGDDGVLFVYAAGPKAVLAVIGPMGSNAGLIHLEARGIAKEIGELF